MANRIVVAAVDDSPFSENYVAWVAANACSGGAQLRVLMCIPEQQQRIHHSSAPPGAPPTSELLARRYPQAQVGDDRRAVLLKGVEIVAAADGSHSGVAEAILQRAVRLRAALLAIAPHSRTAVERVLQGSVTDQVVRRARMPVLVVQGIDEPTEG